ncbi:ciliary microtubule inner protein 2A [Cyrtonyx montezumae]|uniref:ciliary microtubule inner protein 2A n=1 Tax=Cyrtonyx montezumae TaxID=9017 RepID=UPI0032DBA093
MMKGGHCGPTARVCLQPRAVRSRAVHPELRDEPCYSWHCCSVLCSSLLCRGSPRAQRPLLPPNPHHIPGYEGFVPQYNYQFGETYGKTTHRLLADPRVRGSPRSVLALLRRQRFIEDFSGMQHSPQPSFPAHPGYVPYTRAPTSFPEVELGPKQTAPVLEEEELMHMDPWHSHGSSKLRGCPPREAWSPMGAPEAQEWRLPPIHTACRQGRGVTVPAAVKGDSQLPRLDVPREIQQKVIPDVILMGTMAHPVLLLGTNCRRGVKEAMAEFDRQQFRERNPTHGFGKRSPQTSWPGSSAGLLPAHVGSAAE